MSRQLVAEKKEKSLAEQIVVIVLFSLLMAGFISFFLKQEKQITQAGFTTLANTFSAKIVSVHSQWFMDKKPPAVIVNTFPADELSAKKSASNKQVVPVNANGWIDTKAQELACNDIWQHVMQLPLVFIKSPISAVEVKKKLNHQGRICRYGIPSGEYFEYHTRSGRVIMGNEELKSDD